MPRSRMTIALFSRHLVHRTTTASFHIDRQYQPRKQPPMAETSDLSRRVGCRTRWRGAGDETGGARSKKARVDEASGGGVSASILVFPAIIRPQPHTIR